MGKIILVQLADVLECYGRYGVLFVQDTKKVAALARRDGNERAQHLMAFDGMQKKVIKLFLKRLVMKDSEVRKASHADGRHDPLAAKKRTV